MIDKFRYETSLTLDQLTMKPQWTRLLPISQWFKLIWDLFGDSALTDSTPYNHHTASLSTAASVKMSTGAEGTDEEFMGGTICCCWAGLSRGGV